MGKAPGGARRGTAPSQNRGQYHHKATLTDHEVDLMRRLHEDEGLSYSELGRMFEVHRMTARSICIYRTR